MTEERPIGEDDLQAYVDGRLAPEIRKNVEIYLRGNPDRAAQVEVDRELRASLREQLAFKAQEPIPARLRIANILGEQRRVHRRLGAAAAAMAWLVTGGAVGWTANTWIVGQRSASMGAPSSGVASDAVTAHRTFVVEVAHPVEVSASQEAHLVQWLSRRLGVPLLAPNLSAQGFRLMGGRLLPGGEQPAAQFMYDDDKGTRLTVYVRPEGVGERTAFRFEAQGELSAFSWIDRGLSYVVTAKADRTRLLSVAETVYQQLDPGDEPPAKKL